MAICPDIPAEHRQAFLSEAEDNMKIWEQTLLSLEKEPTDKELFVDTLGEVANMITGNATSLLNRRKDYSLTITTPAIITGSQVSVRLVPTPTVALGMYTPYGPIEINLSLEQKDGGE